MDVYARAPRQRATIVHGSDGDSSTVYGNGAAWLAAPITERPVTVQALTGGDLQAARIEAELTFPARIKQSFPTWRAGLPSTIDDRDVQVVQGSGAGTRDGDVLLRQGIGAADASGSLRGFRRRPHPDADRLLGLPRSVGRQ